MLIWPLHPSIKVWLRKWSNILCVFNYIDEKYDKMHNSLKMGEKQQKFIYKIRSLLLKIMTQFGSQWSNISGPVFKSSKFYTSMLCLAFHQNLLFNNFHPFYINFLLDFQSSWPPISLFLNFLNTVIDCILKDGSPGMIKVLSTPFTVQAGITLPVNSIEHLCRCRGDTVEVPPIRALNP